MVDPMMGNGIANVVAAAILAGAIIWTGGFGGKRQLDEKEIAELYARAVGDIRNDIVINCGCCGDGERKPERPF
ncbi:MAG: hypothetical protein AB7F91_07690 [Parvularculaceae bacterium]